MSAWIGRSSHGKAAAKIVPPDPRIPRWKGLGADSEEKREPASDIDTVPADSLKALDLDRPIREADMHDRLASASSVAIVESPGGISPPGAPRTVHDPLESHGSRCSAVAMT